ncbi:YggT family protein [Pseudochelatococcus sp. G4_1912]|uniref:YggT family protein n=1 Tax=Pseudochelatococcus sp. G4_1912 TaxID=3114288 RepID=UPI0039C73D88
MQSVLDVVQLVLNLYTYIIIASAILSWLIAFDVVNTRNRFIYAIVNFLYQVTEPLLRPIRNMLPNLGGIDISPVILLLLVFFLQSFIERYLRPFVP